MTILEAATKLGLREITTSVGDNIFTLVDRIYDSRKDVYFNILQTLNNRFDWDCIEVGSQIRYIPQDYCSRIDEI